LIINTNYTHIMNQYSDTTALQRFEKGYTVSRDGCWLWEKSNRDNGYVDFMEDRKRIRAHIWSYLFFIGEYDRALDVDHLCHNKSDCKGGNDCMHRRCVNPNHLEPVSRRVNANRGKTGKYLSDRKFCNHGHEFTEENTQINLSGARKGIRRCRKCRSLDYFNRKQQSL